MPQFNLRFLNGYSIPPLSCRFSRPSNLPAADDAEGQISIKDYYYEKYQIVLQFPHVRVVQVDSKGKTCVPAELLT